MGLFGFHATNVLPTPHNLESTSTQTTEPKGSLHGSTRNNERFYIITIGITWDEGTFERP
jgi:hypothetical protein